MAKLRDLSRPPYKPLYLFSWALVLYTVLIIIWGAWVRVSGSGDGCGDHWPLCNGEMVPLAAPGKTWVEYSHRISTGIYGFLIVLQIILLRRTFPKHHPARSWSALTLLFTISEALIGRQLVVSGLVNESVALARLIVMPLHLLNTALLVGSTVMTAESIRFGDLPRASLPQGVRSYISGVIGCMVIVLATGGIAALGSHLAPSQSIIEGLAQDISQSSHLAVRLRIIHPIVALLSALLIWNAIEKLRESAPSPYAGRLYSLLGKAFGIAVIVGICTLLTLAPVWLKMTHLLIANGLIIILFLCVFHTLRPTLAEIQPSSAGAIGEEHING